LAPAPLQTSGGGFGTALEAEAPGAGLVGSEALVVVVMEGGGGARRAAQVLAGGALERCCGLAGGARVALAVSSLLPMAETRQALQVGPARWCQLGQDGGTRQWAWWRARSACESGGSELGPPPIRAAPPAELRCPALLLTHALHAHIHTRNGSGRMPRPSLVGVPKLHPTHARLPS
jgi:hypothetical protein